MLCCRLSLLVCWWVLSWVVSVLYHALTLRCSGGFSEGIAGSHAGFFVWFACVYFAMGFRGICIESNPYIIVLSHSLLYLHCTARYNAKSLRGLIEGLLSVYLLLLCRVSCRLSLSVLVAVLMHSVTCSDVRQCTYGYTCG